MEIDTETNPDQIKSFRDKSLNVADLNKKRKLEDEQFGLPLSKHQCWKQSLSLNHPTFGSIPEVEEYSSCTFKVKGRNVYDVSETGSAKDSNSFAEDLSDTAMSVHADAKYSQHNRASSSSLDSGFHYSSDGTTVASSSVEKEVLSLPSVEHEPADVELAENLKESLVEHGSDIDYLYSGYGNYSIEQYQEKEIEEILDSDAANPNVYLLSSGRWSVSQEARQTQRKPTIDQEFEQFFSMLML